MLSIGKILGLAIILFVIWQVFKFLETQKKIRESQSSGRGGDEAGAASVDMVECPKCGKWFQAANMRDGRCDTCEKSPS